MREGGKERRKGGRGGGVKNGRKRKGGEEGQRKGGKTGWKGRSRERGRDRQSVHDSDHYDVDKILCGPFLRATLPMTVRSCARVMADTGRQKGS